MKSRKSLLVSLGLVSIILASYTLFMVDGLAQKGSLYRPLTSFDFTVLSGCLFALPVLLFRLFGLKAIYGLLLAKGLLLVAIVDYFVPTDECGHFAYIEHINQTGQVPTVRAPVPTSILSMEEHIYPRPPQRDPSHRGLASIIYQAVHPPIYYLIASGICRLTPGDLIQQFYVLRILGVVALVGFTILLLRFFKEWNPKPSTLDEQILFFVITLFLLIPGLQFRMATVSNIHLTVILCGVFYYVIFRMDQSQTVLTWKQAILFGLLTGTIIMTQFFNVFLVGIGILFLWIRKSFRQIPWYLLSIALVSLPWLLFNYSQYGHLTGWKAIYSLMADAVNPSRTAYGINHVLDQLGPRFFQIFWNPEETKIMRFVSGIATAYLSAVVCIVILSSGISQWRSYRADKKLPIFESLCLLGIGLNFVLLIYLSITEDMPTILGRFMYLSLWPLIFLTFRFFSTRASQTLPFLYAGVLCTAFLVTNTLFSILEKNLPPLP
jgi:hypothetical protein